ncbi:MAG: NADH-quinone oxidoreductase subunit N [Muribaculaceae bacterium]|nr:NADH-quinone oxidoreductase subunit N [Muribaculaceae bacterium]
MDYSQFFAMRMELLVLAVFLIVFLFDTFASDKGRKATTPLAIICFGLATVAGFFCCGDAVTAFNGMYETSPVISTVKCILNIGAFIVLLQAVNWVDSEDGAIRRGEFFELLFVTLFGMYLMISARHFLLFIIGLESASLPLAAMVAFNKNKYESHEAAVKYIFTAVFSSAIFMMGLSFVYALSGGSLYFSDIADMIATQPNSVMLITALSFVIAGFGFKLSLVPFHLWTADTYQGAPTSVTSYLSVISKGSAAFAFLVVLCQVFGSVYSDVWEWMMYALIILTITVGNLFAIRQRNMKRFMAFSSVSQAGYIMLGIIAANVLGMTSMIFYILVYIFSNLGVFGVIQAIENKTGLVSMDDYKGLHKTNPWLSFAMTLAVFSLAGIPPFAGFFSKILIFTSVTEHESTALYVLVLIALINTIISLYYYLLVVKAMWISPDEPVVPSFRSSCIERFALWICTLGIVLLGIISCVYGTIYCVSDQAAANGFFASLL